MTTDSKWKFPIANSKTAAASVAVLCLCFAPAASACGNLVPRAGASAWNNLAPMRAFAAMRGIPRAESTNAATPAAGAGSMLVGMWEITAYSGGMLYDHAFQQFYSDGLEMQNSGLFPPVEGNVCYGVWKQVDARNFKLKHYGWLFDDQGNFMGTFVLTANITVGTPFNSDTYFGSFTADTILPSGKIDPAQHAVGTIQASRLTVE